MSDGRSRIYLDHNATSPLRPEVRRTMERVFGLSHANPSSLHHEGREARGMQHPSCLRIDARLVHAHAAPEHSQEEVILVVRANPTGVPEPPYVDIRILGSRDPAHADFLLRAPAPGPHWPTRDTLALIEACLSNVKKEQGSSPALNSPSTTLTLYSRGPRISEGGRHRPEQSAPT